MKWPWNTELETISPSEIESETPIAAIDAPEEVDLSVPTAEKLPKSSLSEDERTEYARVCADIGFECGDLIRERLEAFLHDEGIHIYNNRQVVEYLDQELGNDWEWRGLRQVDVDELGASGNWHIVADPRNVKFADRPYRGAIPLPVLLTIQKIQKSVPGAFFYISAPKGEDGDPFLMVTNRSMGTYIIERWNEPSFRER